MRALRAAAASLALAVVVTACAPDPAPRAQAVVRVATDAPIPRAGAARDDIVLFDRLRISVFRGASEAPCEGCVRDVVLFGAEPSFGIERGTAEDPIVALVELFAARNVGPDGSPAPETALSTWVSIPPVPDETVVRVAVTLAMKDLGHERGSRARPLAAAPPLTDLGRWPAKRVRCRDRAGDDEVCVPGGVAWMGGALDRPGPVGGHRPRLVRMSPFFVERREVAVGEVRASGLVRTSGGGDPGTVTPCTFEPGGSRDGLPITCISHDLASDICAARGRRLPSEAQHEYLAGGLRGAAYPWGNETPTACTDAVFARSSAEGTSECGPAARQPVRPGSGTRDRLVLDDEEIVDLAGNVREWSREPYRAADDPCHGEGIVTDPECPAAENAPTFSTRGGSFEQQLIALSSEVRLFAQRDGALDVGFRCVRPDE